MSFFLATIGELIIVETCVLWIWSQVLIDTYKVREVSVDYRKLLSTSVGLVLTALAITGLMIFRAYEYLNGHWPFVRAISLCYVLLATGNFMFILTPALGGNTNILRVFIGITCVWVIICLVAA